MSYHLILLPRLFYCLDDHLYAHTSGRYVLSTFIQSGYVLVLSRQVYWTSFVALAWEKTEGESSGHFHEECSLWRWVHSIHLFGWCTQGKLTMIVCYFLHNRGAVFLLRTFLMLIDAATILVTLQKKIHEWVVTTPFILGTSPSLVFYNMTVHIHIASLYIFMAHKQESTPSVPNNYFILSFLN